MVCLPSWKRNRLKLRRDKLIAQIDALDITMDEAIASGKIVSYEFDSGEGKQKATYRSINELEKLRETLEARLARIFNELACRSVVNLNLNRYGRGNNGISGNNVIL